jgi:hypothetical protein
MIIINNFKIIHLIDNKKYLDNNEKNEFNKSNLNNSLKSTNLLSTLQEITCCDISELNKIENIISYFQDKQKEKEIEEKNKLRNNNKTGIGLLNSNYLHLNDSESGTNNISKMRHSEFKIGIDESDNEKSFNNTNKRSRVDSLSFNDSSKRKSNIDQKSPLDKAFEKFIPNVNLLNMSKIQEESSFFPSNFQSLQQNNFDFKSNIPIVNKEDLKEIVYDEAEAEAEYDDNYNYNDNNFRFDKNNNYNEDEKTFSRNKNNYKNFNFIIKNYIEKKLKNENENLNKINYSKSYSSSKKKMKLKKSNEKIKEINMEELIIDYPMLIEDLDISYLDKERMFNLEKRDIVGNLFYQILIEGQENDYEIYQKDYFETIFIKEN